jgi:putative endonuclease
MKDGYTYILSNKNRTTFYIGVTNDLKRRMFEHKAGKGSKFCKKYNLNELLYFEQYNLMTDAINREKKLKRWRKKWKWDLIEKLNPNLIDLSESWFDKEDLKEIEAYRNSKEESFQYAPPLDNLDPG